MSSSENQLPASAAGTSTSTCPLISPSASLAPLPRPSTPSSPSVAPKTEPLASRSAAPSPSHTAGVEKALGELSLVAQHEGAEPSTGGSEGTEADEGEEEKLEPVFDRMDGCWRCAICLWEVSCGVCDGCEREYEINEEMETLDARITYANTSLAFPVSDKKRNVQHDTQLDDSSSDEEPLSDDDERTLHSLGAPPAMIKRYKLSYSSSFGVVATADLALRNHFDIHPSQTVSLPAADDSGAVEVITSAPWRIHLGGRIHLLPEDVDGSLFLFDLLDEIKDVVNNAADRGYECPWVTVVETTEDEIAIAWDAAASEWKEEKAVRVEWVNRRRREEEGEEDCEEFDGALESDEDPDDNSYIDDEELAEPEHELEEDESEVKEESDGESSNPSSPCSWTDSGSEFSQEAQFHDDGGDISDDPTYEGIFTNSKDLPKTVVV